MDPDYAALKPCRPFPGQESLASDPATLAAIREAGTAPELPGATLSTQPLPSELTLASVESQAYREWVNRLIADGLMRLRIELDTPPEGG